MRRQVFGIACLVMCVVCAGCTGDGGKSLPGGGKAIEASALYEAYKIDEHAAIEAYDDKIHEITGQVTKAWINEANTPFVHLGGPDGKTTCQFWFITDDQESMTRVTALEEGQTVTIRGRSIGLDIEEQYVMIMDPAILGP